MTEPLFQNRGHFERRLSRYFSIEGVLSAILAVIPTSGRFERRSDIESICSLAFCATFQAAIVSPDILSRLSVSGVPIQ
jgi:hypothetical protein